MHLAQSQNITRSLSFTATNTVVQRKNSLTWATIFKPKPRNVIYFPVHEFQNTTTMSADYLVHSVVMKHDSCKKKLSLREVLYESQPTAVFPGRNLLLDIPVGE